MAFRINEISPAGAPGNRLLHASDLPREWPGVYVKVKGFRRAPDGFRARCMMNFDAIKLPNGLVKNSIGLNQTNCGIVQRAIGDDFDVLIGQQLALVKVATEVDGRPVLGFQVQLHSETVQKIRTDIGFAETYESAPSSAEQIQAAPAEPLQIQPPPGTTPRPPFPDPLELSESDLPPKAAAAAKGKSK